MTVERTYIARDCWWNHPSGDNYITDQDQNLSTYDNGLYQGVNIALGDDDTKYIKFHGSGTLVDSQLETSRYTFRTENTNLVPSGITVGIRAQSTTNFGTSANININDVSIGSFGQWRTVDGIIDWTKTIELTPNQMSRILYGRIDDNYDYMQVYFTDNAASTLSPTMYDIEVSYSGDTTWNNYKTGITNIESQYYYSDKLLFRGGSSWVDQNSNSVNYSGVYIINQPPSGVGVDTDYIEQISPPSTVGDQWENQTITLPSGGLSLLFKASDPPPFTKVTRAQLQLRMSLPPSGLYENSRDIFEVNGYNSYVKENDYKDDLDDVTFSVQSKESKYGYFLYGAGSIVEGSGFSNYDVELNFLDPSLLSSKNGDIADTYYQNIDIFDNMEFKIVGLPSGVQLSAAELYLEYMTDNMCSLYIPGHVYRCPTEVFPDSSGIANTRLGNGMWHHRTDLNEETIFTNFFALGDGTGNKIYSNDSAVYADYKNSSGSIITPTWYNYYRNPYTSNLLYYRDLLLLDGYLDFSNRISIGSEFSLYFMISGSGTSNNWNGHYFAIGSDITSESNTDMYGYIENNIVTFDIKNSLGFFDTSSITIDRTSQPILIFITSREVVAGTFKYTMSIHDRPYDYFGRDWKTTTYNGQARYQSGGAVTIVGHLNDSATGDSNLALCEFANNGSGIILSTLVSDQSVNSTYGYDTEDDRKFFSSRVLITPSLYPSGNTIDCSIPDSGVNWVVKSGSGEARWNTKFYMDDWYKNSDIKYELNGQLTTAYNNYESNPSGIYIETCIDNITNHPSGAKVFIDIELDSGSSDNWKLWRTEITVPSGSDQFFKQSFTKHVGLNEPVRLSDISNMLLNIHTIYDDIGNNEYYGNTTINSVKIFMDTMCVAATGIDSIDLYTNGTPTTSNSAIDLYLQSAYEVESLDLFIHGWDSVNDNTTTLYIPGAFLNNSTSLYTYGKELLNDNIPLFLSNKLLASGINSEYPSGLPLFIDGIFKENATLPLYTIAPTPIPESGIIDLYVWGTTNPAIRDTTTLQIGNDHTPDPERLLPLFMGSVITGDITSSMNLYLKNKLPSYEMPLYIFGPSGITNSVDLYITTPSGTEGAVPLNSNMNLFINRVGEDSTANNLTMYIDGPGSTSNLFNLYTDGVYKPTPSSIPLYIMGQSTDNNNNIELYTHGF